MIPIKRCVAAALCSLGFALPASATTFSVDFTDLWFIPAESGWGINLIQQSDTMFATLFVYSADTQPHWYVASALKGTNGTTFTGQLFETHGPVFSGAFNPAAVTVTPVGTMTLTFTSVSTATLVYTVNGQSVTKSIQRQSFTAENISGAYLGGLTATGSGCGNGATNGPVLIFDTLTVTQTGNNVAARVDFFTASASGGSQPAVCNFNGTYSQTGRLGSVSGGFTCSFNGVPGNVGSFTISQINAQVNGFTGAFQGSDQFCSSYSGFFGGVRDVPH